MSNLINRAAVTGKTMYEPLNTGSATTRNQLSGFTYDAAGNMTQNGGTNYVYDAENRLLSANGVTYTYDGDGNRVMKSSGPIYWGAGPLEETDLNGNMQHEYIFFNGKRVVRGDADFSVHYYFSDHLNSTSVMTDASGNIQEDLDYYPYGGIASGTYADPFLFNGKERDTETGFYNFGARYDTANLGRCMTPDWAVKPTTVPYADFGNPQSLNLYAYVENNPTTLGDPDGHCDICWEAVNIVLDHPDAAAAVMAVGTRIATTATTIASDVSATILAVPVLAATYLISPGGHWAKDTIAAPTRPGTKGKPDHQQTAKEEADRIGGKQEVPIPTPGGQKGSRRADAAQVGSDGKLAPGGEIVQVYRPTPSGNLPKREKTAAHDIQNATGVAPTMVPVRPIKPKPEGQ